MGDKSSEEIMDDFLDFEKIHNFEGDRGIENLNKICRQLGYTEEGYKYGSSLEQFLSDNSGACTALVEWITAHLDSSSDWKESLIIDDGCDGNLPDTIGPFDVVELDDDGKCELWYDRECYGTIDFINKTVHVENYEWRFDMEHGIDEEAEFEEAVEKYFTLYQYDIQTQTFKLNE